MYRNSRDGGIRIGPGFLSGMLLFLLGATGCAALGLGGARDPGWVYVANMDSNSVSVIDGAELKVVATIDAGGHHTHDLILTPDGRRLFATNMMDGTVAVIDTTTRRLLKNIPVGKLSHALALSPDGRELWVNVGGEAAIPIVDAETLEVTGRVALPEAVGTGHIWFSPDGRRAYLTSPKLGLVFVIDRARREILTTIPVGKSPTFIQVAQDGQTVWGTNTGGSDVYVIDAAANKVRATVEVGKNPNHLTLLGNRVYVTVGGTNEVVVLESRQGQPQVVARIPVGKKPHGIWASPDGRLLYVAHEETNDVRAIEVATGRVVGAVPVGNKPVAVVTGARPVGGGAPRAGASGY